MRGLLLKDFYMMAKYCRSYLLLVGIFVVASFFGENNNAFFLFYPSIIVSMIPLNLYAYDEAEKWCDFCATLPVTRAQYVTAKYLIGLFASTAVVLLSTVSCAVQMLLAGAFVAGNSLSIAATIMAAALIAPSLALPFVFRFGPEKGRIIYLVMVGAAAGVCTFLSVSGRLSRMLSGNMNSATLLPAAICIYAASWWLSIRWYRKAKR